MRRYDFKTEQFQKVSVCGIRCEFSDVRIDCSTVPERKYQYEVPGDDDSGGDPARIRGASWSISLARLSVTSRCLLEMMVYCGWGRGILYGCRIGSGNTFIPVSRQKRQDCQAAENSIGEEQRECINMKQRSNIQNFEMKPV